MTYTLEQFCDETRDILKADRGDDGRDAIRRHEVATRDTQGAVGDPAPQIPADVEAQRRRERADPAVRTAAALRQAWTDRCEAVSEGLDETAADVGFAAVLREMLPPKANDPWCVACVDGLVAGWQAGYRLDRPCVCQAGDQWREKAIAADEARRWTVRKVLEAPPA